MSYLFWVCTVEKESLVDELFLSFLLILHFRSFLLLNQTLLGFTFFLLFQALLSRFLLFELLQLLNE